MGQAGLKPAQASRHAPSPWQRVCPPPHPYPAAPLHHVPTAFLHAAPPGTAPTASFPYGFTRRHEILHGASPRPPQRTLAPPRGAAPSNPPNPRMERTPSPNSAFLGYLDVRLVAIATQAETLFAVDPAACVAKLRLFDELSRARPSRQSLSERRCAKRNRQSSKLCCCAVVKQPAVVRWVVLRDCVNPAHLTTCTRSGARRAR